LQSVFIKLKSQADLGPLGAAPLLLLAVSPQQSTAGPAEPTQFQTLRTLLLRYEGWGSVSAVFFCLSVLLLNHLLYRRASCLV
jgi:hypothetical protein